MDASRYKLDEDVIYMLEDCTWSQIFATDVGVPS